MIQETISDPKNLNTIDDIFDHVTSKFPDLTFELATGGFIDIKGANTTDVDISMFSENYDKLFFVLNPIIKVIKVRKEDRRPLMIYSLHGYNRTVNIWATNDQVLSQRSVIHRKNELMLNQFWKLRQKAIDFFNQGFGSEASWMRAMDQIGDPGKFMLKDEAELIQLASEKEQALP